MSLPGLTLPGLSLASAPTPESLPIIPTASTEPRHHDLRPRTEYRFEVGFAQQLNLKLLNGTAELFGTELACNAKEPYTFRGCKAAIYTWHGCRLQVEGDVESEYVAEETPMTEVANVHFALEGMRDRVAESPPPLSGANGHAEPAIMGPRVLVVGPENAGKTSLVKTLTAYGVKCGRSTVLVNLDPREGMLSVPGSLTAATFASILDVEEGWGSSPISGPSAVPVKMPLVYHYGLGSPDENGKMFRGLVTRLALAVTSRLEADEESRISGCIIDTPGSLSTDKKGVYENIQHIVSEFSINILLVLGSERLHSDLSRRFSSRNGVNSDEPVTVIRLDKSGGCVDRDEDYMKKLRQTQIRQYFFGHGTTTLSPHTHRVDFSALNIFRTIDEGRLYEKIKPSLMIQNGLLAITNAEPNESAEAIRDSSVLGYVYIADVDEAKQQVRLLAPLSGHIPHKAMILGLWPEEVVGLVG
ncbi:mRNA cleavage and polyadenylation factor IA/II complex [Saccharata proteae CBS 121410]|uniref:Polynucleotide 5'-hydroxyl-kinase GRC3 n=1 Tax=Saccharata proteae CBS 121410 TaxID=1314787 RepID=A0A9P4HPR3_9PEZI|nr:mRNA cleavage and polyadenylation factor IA/II complex [Saccharata proteae CBS 121410]